MFVFDYPTLKCNTIDSGCSNLPQRTTKRSVEGACSSSLLTTNETNNLGAATYLMAVDVAMERMWVVEGAKAVTAVAARDRTAAVLNLMVVVVVGVQL